MIQIENTDVLGWEHAIRGMRNPMNSWDKSDSKMCYAEGCSKHCLCDDCDNQYYAIGKNDLDLMKRLVKAGTDHSKFMRMITVYADINAPLYWWKEYDTYKVGTVANSCSTMHKIHAKEFEMKDFSIEHLFNSHVTNNKTITCNGTGELDYLESKYLFSNGIIPLLNFYRKKYLETKDKDYWWQLIQLLPSSYNQRRTVELNYAVLRNMYHSRKSHKLDEWRAFCEWIETLPHSELITEVFNG